MRTSTAYFAGLGTVVVAVAAGLGGGYLAANIVSPHEPGVSKLERRMSATPIPATAAPSEPVAYRGNDCGCDEPDCSAPVAAPPQTEPQQASARRRLHRRLQHRRHRQSPSRRPPPPMPPAPAEERAVVESPPRLRKPSPGRVTPTSSGRLSKSGGPNAASAGKSSAVSGSLASRSWRRSRRKSGRLPSPGRPSPSNG